MRSRYLPALLVLAVAAVVAAVPARAALDIDFGASVPVGDDGHLFLSISSRYFDRDVHVVQDWYGRYRNPDDLAVAFYLSDRCGRSPEWIFSARKQGLGWFEIGNRCELPYDAWFVPVKGDPGPPYGKAYGYWRKHQHDHRAAHRLSDDDCRRLVSVRMAHEYYGVPVETAMSWRASHRDVAGVMTQEYHSRRERDRGHGHDHGRGHGGSENSHGKPGKGNERR